MYHAHTRNTHAQKYACAYTRTTHGKMADCTHGRTTEGVLDLCNGAVSEKTPQIFLPSSPAEYVTAFSGRTDAPEVRCDLTDRHTHTHDNYSNPRCACAPRVNNTLTHAHAHNIKIVCTCYCTCFYVHVVFSVCIHACFFFFSSKCTVHIYTAQRNLLITKCQPTPHQGFTCMIQTSLNCKSKQKFGRAVAWHPPMHICTHNN